MEEYIESLIEEFGADDAPAIAARCGVPIVYESWHPLSAGEFERKSQTIFVNRRALDAAVDAESLRKKIIAHELGHFFAVRLKLGRHEEERFARRFAARLLKEGK